VCSPHDGAGAVNLDLDTPILGASHLSLVIGDRITLALSFNRNLIARDAVLRQVVADGLRAAKREFFVVGNASNRIGVTDDLDRIEHRGALELGHECIQGRLGARM